MSSENVPLPLRLHCGTAGSIHVVNASAIVAAPKLGGDKTVHLTWRKVKLICLRLSTNARQSDLTASQWMLPVAHVFASAEPSIFRLISGMSRTLLYAPMTSTPKAAN